MNRDLQNNSCASPMCRLAPVCREHPSGALCGMQDFPAPVRIGRRAVAWLDTEIDGWIADCVKARNTLRCGAANGRA